MKSALSIGVVGAGTAGAASATFLARCGHRVTVYEAVPEPSAVGAGIILQPTGMQVLHRLGVLPRVLARAARLDGLLCETGQGVPVVEIAYRDVHPDLYGLGVHRGVLFRALFDAAKEAGAEMRCGVAIDALDQKRGCRPRLMTAHGKRFGPHDLVIVADGARSQLRDDVATVTRDQRYPWGALWFVATDDAREFQRQLFQVVDGTGTMIGLLPTGLGPACPGSPDRPRVSFFYSVRMNRVRALRARGLSAFKADVLRHAPRAAPILEQMTSMDDLLAAGYHDVVLRRFHEGRVVFLGDAAHAMSPQLGQGANLALYDAMILSECLEDAASSPDTVASALALYERRRRGPLAFYQFATRWLTPFFQSDYDAISVPRDLLLGTASRLPFFRDLMVRTMAGVKCGIFTPSLPIAPLREAIPARLPPAP